MPAPDALSTADVPLQIVTPEPVMIVGMEFTATVTVAILIQPDALVPVIVYIVVADGLADTLVPVVAERPVDGDQM